MTDELSLGTRQALAKSLVPFATGSETADKEAVPAWDLGCLFPMVTLHYTFSLPLSISLIKMYSSTFFLFFLFLPLLFVAEVP